MMRNVLLIFFVVIVFLLCSGVLLVSTAAEAQAVRQSLPPNHYLMQQLIWTGIAVVVGGVLSRIDYHWYAKKEFLWVLAIGMIVALALVWVPGLGHASKGSLRWIKLGRIQVQPSEFIKLGMIVFLAGYLERIGGCVKRLWDGMFVLTAVAAATILPIVFQPDFGCAMIISCVCGVMWLVGGLGWTRCMLLGFIACCGIAALLLTNENRLRRLSNESEGANYQAEQSELAFKQGGLYGVGIGKGIQKQLYLPESHTDFIFAVAGEDLGLVATATLWAAFLVLFVCGVIVAFNAPDKQGMLLAFGATILVSMQAVGNMCVVTHLVPTKGLALPFISYGGSSLVVSVATVALIFNVGHSIVTKEKQASGPVKDRILPC